MANQGCPGEGTDTRRWPRITCGLQRTFSFHTRIEPLSILVAFPPFTAINCPIPERLAIWLHRKRLPPDRQWYLMARGGFRYDKNWNGYIVPEFALKVLDHTVLY